MDSLLPQTCELEALNPALPGYGIDPAELRRYALDTDDPVRLRFALQIALDGWETWHAESLSGPCALCQARQARWAASHEQDHSAAG